MKKKHLLVWGFCGSILYSGLGFAKPQMEPVFQQGVTPAIVWHAPEAMFNQCAKEETAYQDCILNYMQSHNASPEAIAFYKLSNGFAVDLRMFGNVNVVKASIRAADHSEGFFLIARSGQSINASDYDLISSVALNKAPAYLTIKQKNPKVMLWPLAVGYPQFVPLAKGGSRFVFSYELKDGCNACAILGTVQLGFEFNAGGKFLGVKLLNVAPVAETAQTEKKDLDDSDEQTESNSNEHNEDDVAFQWH